MDLIPIHDILCSIKPDLKIFFDDEPRTSVTTTIVMPSSCSFYSRILFSPEFHRSFEDMIENFFKTFDFSSLNLLIGHREEILKNDSEELKDDLKEEVSYSSNEEDDIINDKEEDIDWSENNFDSPVNEELISIKRKKRKKEKDIKNEFSASSKIKVSCPSCGKMLDSYYYEKYHKVKCEGKSEDKFNKGNAPVMCQICGKTTVNKTALESHMKNIHAEKKYKCDQCEFRTGNDYLLGVHIKKVHGKKEYMCEKCDYSSTSKGSLDKHLQTHLAREPKTCTICGKSVLCMSTHMRNHNTEMGSCDICGKEMKKVRINCHKRKVHAERKYPCLQCSYKASTNFNLKLHVSKSHLGIKDLVKDQCPHCDFQTTNLERHLRIHHPEK